MYCVLYIVFTIQLKRNGKINKENTSQLHRHNYSTSYKVRYISFDKKFCYRQYVYKVVNAKRMDLKMGAFLMEVEKDESAFIYVLR